MTVLTPPPERDVPPAVRARLLAGLAGLDGPAAPARRRWVPVAAAAAAVVALAVPAVVLTRDGAPAPARPPVSSPGTLPDERTIVQRCLDGDPAPAEPPRVYAVYTDARVWAAWVGSDGFSATCSYTWDGKPDQVGAGSRGEPEPTWAPATEPSGLVPGPYGGGGDGAGGIEYVVVGTVARDVTRVELRWGGQRVRAAVRGPYFVAPIHGDARDVRSDLVAVASRADGTEYEPEMLLPGEQKPRTGGPQLGAGMPAEDLLLRRCRWDADRDGAWSRGVTMRAVFRDERGYVAYVGAPGKESVCAYRFGGTADLTIGTIEHGGDTTRDGYADPRQHPGGVDAMDSRGGLLPDVDDAHRVFFGTVVPGVTRVTVRVNGGQPVEAAVRGPFYVARVIFPAPGGRIAVTAVIDAYDAAGTRVGSSRVVG